MSDIVHVYVSASPNEATIRRELDANRTWEREAERYGGIWAGGDIYYSYNMADIMCDKSIRTAIDIGDTVALPFIHDMINSACVHSDDDDIIVLTNADTCMVEGLFSEIAEKCKRHGAVFCHRWDFKDIKQYTTRDQIHVHGTLFSGRDLFAMTKRWWLDHQAELPPFVIGRECWDWAFEVLITETGGVEIERGIYHEIHSSPWQENQNLAGNSYNRGYFIKFMELRPKSVQDQCTPMPEIKAKSIIPAVWDKPYIDYANRNK